MNLTLLLQKINKQLFTKDNAYMILNEYTLAI